MTDCLKTGCRYLETKCVDCGRLIADRMLPNLDKSFLQERFKMIIDNYVTNGTFIEIPKLQRQHLLEQLLQCLDDEIGF